MMRYRREKRVTDPLADSVRARLIGTSGSDHSGCEIDDSPCLSDLVHGFLEDVPNDADAESHHQSDSESSSDSERVGPAPSECRTVDAAEEVAESVRNCLREDSYGTVLLVHVLKAFENFSSFHVQDGNHRAVLRREVMSFLRGLGHNAAICKTKWNSSGGLTAGSHEFIDVVVLNSVTVRYIVEIEFASAFEVARPTGQYARVMHALPRVFVGKCEDLRLIVRLACDAARRSLKIQGLTVPPWRKNRYMQTRWLGPYRRTTNLTPSSGTDGAVKCRSVGFVNASGGSPLH